MMMIEGLAGFVLALLVELQKRIECGKQATDDGNRDAETDLGT